MLTNRWIETSCQIYAAFLAIYPQEHRAEYSESMRQVFTDQCRSAYEQRGALGLIALWLRTLPDLGCTALLEHVTSPRATWGLLEPVPNEPLPWKGVLLILLPGLVYLISQIAQLTGLAWYLVVYYRAAFFLIVPVLAVWVITRRFPIWGLIPLGLLYRLLQEIGYQLITLHPEAFSGNLLLNQILNFARLVQQELWLLIIPMVLAMLFLAWRYASRQKLSRAFWLWLGIYLLAVLIQITNGTNTFLQTLQQIAPGLPLTQQKMYFEFITNQLYQLIPFLLLIFIGTLFTRRHGFLAILILVGYLLPTLVVGIPGYLDLDSNLSALLILSTAVLVFRALLALLAPIWVARTSSETSQQRAVIISIVLALGIHAAMQFFPWLAFPEVTYQPQVIAILASEISLFSGLCLASALYRTQPFKQLEIPKLSGEKS